MRSQGLCPREPETCPSKERGLRNKKKCEVVKTVIESLPLMQGGYVMVVTAKDVISELSEYHEPSTGIELIICM